MKVSAIAANNFKLSEEANLVMLMQESDFELCKSDSDALPMRYERAKNVGMGQSKFNLILLLGILIFKYNNSYSRRYRRTIFESHKRRRHGRVHNPVEILSNRRATRTALTRLDSP